MGTWIGHSQTNKLNRFPVLAILSSKGSFCVYFLAYPCVYSFYRNHCRSLICRFSSVDDKPRSVNDVSPWYPETEYLRRSKKYFLVFRSKLIIYKCESLLTVDLVFETTDYFFGTLEYRTVKNRTRNFFIYTYENTSHLPFFSSTLLTILVFESTKVTWIVYGHNPDRLIYITTYLVSCNDGITLSVKFHLLSVLLSLMSYHSVQCRRPWSPRTPLSYFPVYCTRITHGLQKDLFHRSVDSECSYSSW